MNDSYGHGFLAKLWQDIGKRQKDSHREFATQVFAAVVPTAALYSQYVAQVVDFYLDHGRKADREEIVRLVASADQNASAKVMAYVNEALRLRPPVSSLGYLISNDANHSSQLPGVYRTAARDDILDSVEVKSGTYVFASIADANLDVSTLCFF
jgi:linoleate 10R-lipoxygenase